jgi:hypothetical protein
LELKEERDLLRQQLENVMLELDAMKQDQHQFQSIQLVLNIITKSESAPSSPKSNATSLGASTVPSLSVDHSNCLAELNQKLSEQELRHQFQMVNILAEADVKLKQAIQISDAQVAKVRANLLEEYDNAFAQRLRSALQQARLQLESEFRTELNEAQIIRSENSTLKFELQQVRSELQSVNLQRDSELTQHKAAVIRLERYFDVNGVENFKSFFDSFQL